MRPFDPLRAAFMLAIIILIATVVGVLGAEGSCFYLVLTSRVTLSECRDLDLRSAVADMVAVVIILLRVFEPPRSPPGGPPDAPGAPSGAGDRAPVQPPDGGK